LVGQDGETHQGIYDVTFIKAIPNTIIAMPSDFNELNKLVNLGFNNGMFFIRYPRGKVVNESLTNNNIKIGQWDYVLKQDEARATLIVTGPNIHQVLKQVSSKNLKVNIVYARFYKPIDTNLLRHLEGKVIVYDIYSTSNGLFETISATFKQYNSKQELYNFSLKNEFYPHGSIEDLLKKAQLDVESFINEVIKIIQ